MEHGPQVALTELVANARDASAARADLILPAGIGGTLAVMHNGNSMTLMQFGTYWMKL